MYRQLEKTSCLQPQLWSTQREKLISGIICYISKSEVALITANSDIIHPVIFCGIKRLKKSLPGNDRIPTTENRRMFTQCVCNVSISFHSNPSSIKGLCKCVSPPLSILHCQSEQASCSRQTYYSKACWGGAEDETHSLAVLC